MITFTDIRWKNNEDSSIFNMHSIKYIELDGMSQGIITIHCTTNTFKAPYYKMNFGGGIDHFSLITKHPYKMGEFIEIAIFDKKVCVLPSTRNQEPWFEYKCKTYVACF